MAEAACQVLVVDDDPDIRAFVSEVLADEGYRVREAGNGREALDLLDGWRPDVILLDLMMPEMDGWAFLTTRQAVPQLAEIPVVVMSAAYTLRRHEEHLPVAEVLMKPFRIDQLLSLVASFAPF